MNYESELIKYLKQYKYANKTKYFFIAQQYSSE